MVQELLPASYGLCLPQAQVFESPDCSVHFSEHKSPSLQLQVRRNKVARGVTQKRQFMKKLFIAEFFSVFPSAFHELTDLLAQLETSFQHLSPA